MIRSHAAHTRITLSDIEGLRRTRRPTFVGMKRETNLQIRSAAIGQRITALRYDAEAGYVVVELESGEELWVASDYSDGYHLVHIGQQQNE